MGRFFTQAVRMFLKGKVLYVIFWDNHGPRWSGPHADDAPRLTLSAGKFYVAKMRERVDFSKLPTERGSVAFRAVDRLSTPALLRLLNREDARAVRAVRAQLSRIAQAVDLLVGALRGGGRILFIGAGTSGRLGVLEAAECPPTFNTPPSLIQALIAGGRRAVFRSVEGAEDGAADARRWVSRRMKPMDAVVGVAASGVTPFVQAGLLAARRRGAKTILITCNPSAPRGGADVVIPLRTGPEVIAGSTRLKAGTATKLVLNALTVGVMTRIGKVYGNKMVDVQPRSRKLRARAERLIVEIGGVGAARARRFLNSAGGDTKTAIVMARLHIDKQKARRLLRANHGQLGAVLGE